MCSSLRQAFSRTLVKIGIVRGDRLGSFADVEDIIVTARENLRRAR